MILHECVVWIKYTPNNPSTGLCEVLMPGTDHTAVNEKNGNPIAMIVPTKPKGFATLTRLVECFLSHFGEDLFPAWVM